MIWRLSFRAEKTAARIADRHYNRQHIGSPQFVPPGRCLVLLSETLDSLWVSSFPLAEYTKHEWSGAWVNSCFRREGVGLASDMIRQAVSCTRWFWGDPPELGMITFIDRSKVRRKRDYGRCYRKAGFKVCGETKGGLLALQLLPQDMPTPEAPMGSQGSLFSTGELTGKPS